MSKLLESAGAQSVYPVDAVRELDRCAIEDNGIAGYTLMTRAGEAAYAFAVELFPAANRWQVVCGAGNNAGDGYVVARLAAMQGIPVSVVTLIDPESLTGDASTAYRDFAATGGEVTSWDGRLDAEADLLFDGLLGSGLARPVDGAFADVVGAINDHPAPVIALDIPSGIDGDTGQVCGCAVHAAATITFVGLKTGLYLGDAPDHCGAIRLADLDVPAECRRNVPGSMRCIAESVIAAALPARPRAAHKGDFGHVVVVGGGPGMPGAVRITGEACLRTGAGLVTVATHPSHHASVTVARPELMCRAASDSNDIEDLLARATVVALGPGLGGSEWGEEMFAAAIECKRPLVVDADGLNILAGRELRRDDWILTPHPGEAARMLGTTTAAIQADRPAALASLVERFGGTVVLKGAGSLISSESGQPWLCTAGNPGMAAPGMGDALTGIVAALRAQGFDAEDAAVLGVDIHARAGDAAAARGERGMLVSDLLEEIRAWVNL